MNLSKVSLRQLDEKLTHQLRHQEVQIDLQKQQIELLRAIDKTYKDKDAYIKRSNQDSTNFKKDFLIHPF